MQTRPNEILVSQISQLTRRGQFRSADVRAFFDRFGGTFFAISAALLAVFTAWLYSVHGGRILNLPEDIGLSSTEDLRAFWRAGQMALRGEALAAYDSHIFTEPFPANGKGLLWLNPPHAFLVFLPFGTMSYASAKAIWLGASILAFAAIARIAAPQYKAAAVLIFLTPAAYVSFIVLQSAPFMALLLMCGMLTSRERPILSGVLFAVLTIKPQYGLMVPVFLAARGDWRAFGWTTVFSGAFALASIFAYGVESWAAFLHANSRGHAEAIHRDMVTLAQAAGKAGGNILVRAAAQVAAIVLSAAVTFLAARKLPNADAVAIAVLASAAAAPSFWVYDFAFIAAAYGLLLRRAPWPLAVQAAAAIAFAAPFIPFAFGTNLSSVATSASLLLALATVGFWRMTRLPAAEAINVDRGRRE